MEDSSPPCSYQSGGYSGIEGGGTGIHSPDTFWHDLDFLVWLVMGEFQSIKYCSLVHSQRIFLDVSPNTHNGLFLRHLLTGQRIHLVQEKGIEAAVLSFSNPLHTELKQPWIVAGRCPIKKAEGPIFLPQDFSRC